MPALVVALVVRQERPKAIQIVQDGPGRIIWVPRSQILDRCPRAGERNVDVLVTDWFWDRLMAEAPDSQGNWVSS